MRLVALTGNETRGNTICILTQGGFSLLMGACKIGRPYIVDVLLRNGATVDLRDKVYMCMVIYLLI